MYSIIINGTSYAIPTDCAISCTKNQDGKNFLSVTSAVGNLPFNMPTAPSYSIQLKSGDTVILDRVYKEGVESVQIYSGKSTASINFNE